MVVHGAAQCSFKGKMAAFRMPIPKLDMEISWVPAGYSNCRKAGCLLQSRRPMADTRSTCTRRRSCSPDATPLSN